MRQCTPHLNSAWQPVASPEEGTVATTMVVSDSDIEAFLACPTRAYLRSTTDAPSDPQFSEHRTRVADFFRCQQRTAQKGKMVSGQFPMGATIRDAFQQTGARILFDFTITAGNINTTIHAVERLPGTAEGPVEQFIPFRYIPCTRITKEHRVLLRLTQWSSRGRPAIFRNLVGSCTEQRLVFQK